MKLLQKQRVAALLPINAAGHYQCFLAIANQLRLDHNVRCVFVITGPPHGRVIEDHGHQLIELEDLAEPFWDFELEIDEDLTRPMSEKEELRRLRQGKKKKPFKGATRWPQFMARFQYLFRENARNQTDGLVKFFEHISMCAIQNNDQLERAINSLNPDIIISDISLIPPSVIRLETTRPWVRIYSPNPMSLLISKLPGSIKPPAFRGHKLYTKEERARLQQDEPEVWANILAEWAKSMAGGIMREAYSDIRQLYIDNGLGERLIRADDDKIRIDSPHLNIYMFPEALDYDKDDDLFEYPARWVRCDSLMRKQTGRNDANESEHWTRQIEAKMHDEKLTSIVYLSLGSIASGDPSLMQRYIDFLSSDQSKRLYIISKGVNGHKVALNERNMLGGNYLPQTFLLQKADLAIIHGGNNSLTESLYYGKPIIVLPAFVDQLDNAQRIEDLGLGKRLSLHNCTRAELLDAIDELLGDEQLKARVHSIGVSMRARDDLERVSSIILGLIDKRQSTDEIKRELQISS